MPNKRLVTIIYVSACPLNKSLSTVVYVIEPPNEAVHLEPREKLRPQIRSCLITYVMHVVTRVLSSNLSPQSSISALMDSIDSAKTGPREQFFNKLTAFSVCFKYSVAGGRAEYN